MGYRRHLSRTKPFRSKRDNRLSCGLVRNRRPKSQGPNAWDRIYVKQRHTRQEWGSALLQLTSENKQEKAGLLVLL